MAYTPTVWKNGEFPPIDAEHLNKIEQGIANSAPGGFGLGGAAKMLTEADNVDNIRESGWYTWDWDPSKQPAGLPEEAKYHTGNMRVDGTTGGNCTTQTIYFAKNGSSVSAGDECVIQRLRTTAPWEWVNPPMILGTEYRTTERHLGKPVNTKLLDGGFEAWRPDGQSDWASAGKAVLFSIEKGGTKNISLTSNRTYIFSATDNVHSGAAIVQADSSGIQAITPLVSSVNWKIEAGSGLSVNVTETDGRYGVIVSAMML